MTSVASYGAATTAGNFTLCFSGTRLGGWIENFTSKPQRVTDVAVRQNFWSTTVILDGSYPAFTWDHEFKVYTEAGSRLGFADVYFELAANFFSRSRPLQIRAGDTTSVHIDFGNCYLKPFDLDSPGELLLHRGGMIRLQFIGTQTPSVVF
jgi:hypothetical protein